MQNFEGDGVEAKEETGGAVGEMVQSGRSEESCRGNEELLEDWQSFRSNKATLWQRRMLGYCEIYTILAERSFNTKL